MRIGFIGIGKMGWPLAGHLRAAGHAVVVADSSLERREAARGAGFEVMEAQALAGAADVVFSSLPHDAALDAVSRTVCAGARAGTAFIDTSTVSPAVSRIVAERCAAAGIGYLRVTLSGNNKMAEAAQLTVLCSGPRELYERMLPLLEVFGPARFFLGGDEQARLMKLVVNLMIAQTSAMLAEALTLGARGGLDWEDMWQVIAASAVASPIVKSKAGSLSRQDFAPTFTVLQMQKDLDLILEAGDALHAPLPGTAQTREWMKAAVAMGWAEEDYAAIIKVAQKLAGG